MLIKVQSSFSNSHFSAKTIAFSTEMELLNLYCKSTELHNPSKKLAFFISSIFYDAANSICKGSLNQVKNFNSISFPGILSFNSSTSLEITLMEVMRRIVPTGIPQYFCEYYYNAFSRKYVEIKEKLPRVLTVADLLFGFNLWLCACGISIIGFVFEILKHAVSSNIRNCVVLAFLSNFINNKLQRV